MNPNTSGENRRHAILAAALHCFTEYGFERTTTRMIQARAGASVGSFYHHFGSKAGVAGQLFLAGLRDKNRVVLAALAASEGAQSGIKSVVTAHIDWIVDQPDWARFLYQHRGVVQGAAIEAELQSVNKRFSGALLDYFSPHLEAGRLRSLPGECYSVILLGPVQEYARRWLAGRARTPLGDLRAVFADAAWRALGTHRSRDD